MSSPVRMVVPTDAYPNSLTKHMLSICEEVVPAPFLPSVCRTNTKLLLSR